MGKNYNAQVVINIALNEVGYLEHLYYGKKIPEEDITYLTRQFEYGFSNSEIFREKHSLLDFLPQEYPTEGVGDYRESALSIYDKDNHNAIELVYKNHNIYLLGKYHI